MKAKRRKPPVYHRICPGCGLAFEGTGPKSFLCFDCDPDERLAELNGADSICYPDDDEFAVEDGDRDKLF